MESGRELDLIVAERVMGWRGVGYPAPGRHPDGVYTGQELMGYPVGSHNWCEVPYYSTDTAAAWKIVENLNARGWRVEVFSTARVGVDVQISKWGGPHHEGDYADSAPTAPHAICLAALRAVGVDL